MNYIAMHLCDILDCKKNTVEDKLKAGFFSGSSLPGKSDNNGGITFSPALPTWFLQKKSGDRLTYPYDTVFKVCL